MSSLSPSSSLQTMASSPSSSPPAQAAYACDTLPPPQSVRLSRTHRGSRSPSPIVAATSTDEDMLATAFHEPVLEDVRADDRFVEFPSASPVFDVLPTPKPLARKLCVRHQRMADRGTNLMLQQSLDALPLEDREVVTSVWSTFSSSPHSRRELILNGLLQLCCYSQLSMVSEQMSQLTRLDPFTVLPREVALKVLGYLDAISLCRAAQVSRQWSALADDDILWRNICEQHIGQKCHKCGWGLPMLERRRRIRKPTSSQLHDGPLAFKRDLEDYPAEDFRASKRLKTPSAFYSFHTDASDAVGSNSHQESRSTTCVGPSQTTAANRGPETVTRPWKDVYCERLTIERNWRRGRCTVRTLNGHTDGVMCVQFNESLEHPSFPVLISGSYDRTARVWNMETGTEVRCLRGHSRAIRALQFDNAKLITGSMDHTMRVWNWRTGRCLRILEGHTEGVVCLNFDSNVLASGSVDTTVKVWNFRTGVCFTLRGHRDWVNSVQLWDSAADSKGTCSSPSSEPQIAVAVDSSTPPTIDPGKMLFSASDDGTIRFWDLTSRSCVRQFTGHVGQVQSMKLLLVDPPCDGANWEHNATSLRDSGYPRASRPRSSTTSISLTSQSAGGDALSVDTPPSEDHNPHSYLARHNSAPSGRTNAFSSQPSTRSSSPLPNRSRPTPVLISGSLDSTIRVWDVDSGKSISTLFGHIEGVWAVASDKLRLVSGSHDRTIKVWVREEGRCLATLVGHTGAVTCLALGDDKIVSGSDDHDIRIWSFTQ